MKGVIRLMNGGHTAPMNICNPGDFSIRELTELVYARINPDLLRNEKFSPADAPLQLQPVIDLVQRDLV